jgi:hypothetical protein
MYFRIGSYIASGQYTRCFGTTSLRILVVTTSSERLANLKRATEQAGGQSLFWLTTLKQASAEAILSERIWQVAGREGVTGLITGSPEKGQASQLPVLLRSP